MLLDQADQPAGGGGAPRRLGLVLGSWDRTSSGRRRQRWRGGLGARGWGDAAAGRRWLDEKRTCGCGVHKHNCAKEPLPARQDLGQVRSPSHCVSVYVKAPIRFPLFSLMWNFNHMDYENWRGGVTLRMSCSTSRELTSLEAQVNLFQWPRDHFFHVASMASEQFFTAVSLNGCVSRLLAATQTYYIFMGLWASSA